MKVGDTLSWSRTFTEQDIELFARLSGDQGEHHLVPDAQGRLMAHGLLTATLPTKIGGDLNLIAREMVFRFHRPVFAGRHDRMYRDVNCRGTCRWLRKRSV
jgi:acyl dehydratase